MKKSYKYITVMMLCALAVIGQSCSSSYADIGYIPDGDENQNKEDYSTFAITPTLNLTSLLYATSNKLESKAVKISELGEGPIDPQDKENFVKRYAKAKFYILAYRKSIFTDVPGMTGETDYSQLMSSDEDRKNCLLSTERTSLAKPTQHIGKLALPKGYREDGMVSDALFRDGSLVLMDNTDFEDNGDEPKWTETLYYWNKKKYEGVGYNFYAYYIDKAVIYGTERTPERVALDVQINGKNDMMVGMAPQVTDSILRVDYAKSVTEDSIRTNILKYGDGAYSTYGAVHSVEPRINLRHAMARIRFRAVSQDPDAKVMIADVKVEAPSRGKLVVAARDSSELGLRDLKEVTELALPYTPDGKDMVYNDTIQLGEGIMIPPKEAYKVKVMIKQRDIKTEQTQEGEHYEPSELVIAPEGGIKEGCIYDVLLKVQGLKVADVIVTMPEPWEYIGNGNIDMFDK